MTARTVTTAGAGLDGRTGLETDVHSDDTGVSIHARVIAEANDCKWCGGDLSGRVETAAGSATAAVTCDDCGRDYV